MYANNKPTAITININNISGIKPIITKNKRINKIDERENRNV